MVPSISPSRNNYILEEFLDEHPSRIMFGTKVGILRKSLGLTLKELSASSQVSVSMLSEIERGNRQPTIDVACRIAKALGTSLGHLIDEKPSPSRLIIRVEDQPVLVDPKSGIRRISLSPMSGQDSLEFLRFELPPKAVSGSFPAHESGTVEYVSVLKGEVIARLEDEQYHLREGDCFYYRADCAHGFENPANKDACLHVIIYRSSASY